MKRCITKNSVKGLIACVVFVACGLGYYFLYFIKTPVYSLNLVRESVQKKDIIQFEQHVDINSIIDRGYDKIVAFMMKQQNEIAVDNPYALGFAQLMKPAVVAKFTTEAKNYIQDEFNKTDKHDGKANDSNKDKAKPQGIKDIKQEVIHDADAIVSFVAVAKDNTDVQVRCRMEKLANGEWKIIEIMNLDELFQKAMEFEKKGIK